MRVWQYSRENPALYGRRRLVLVYPARDVSSLSPCLHEEADTRLFTQATETAKRPNKKISSCTVDTDVVVLVIPVVQQLWLDELRVGKNRWLSLVWHQNCLALSAIKHPLLGRGKRLVSFSAVTGYFLKMYPLPEKATYTLPLHGRTIHHSTVW